MVDSYAKSLDRDFKEKSEEARIATVRRFLKKHRYGIRVGTHVAQQNPAETRELAVDFIQSVRKQLPWFPEQSLILNMDQTPVFFSMEPRTTLNRIGERTVNIRSSTDSTLPVTVGVTVTANGNILPPMIIFKGKSSGLIARSFSSFSEGAVYACQDKAWMDEKMMIQWIEKVKKTFVLQVSTMIVRQVLEPYIRANNPNQERAVLLLDSYLCHLMAPIVTRIQDLGIQVEHIPGGCTGLAQQIDVGIGKPLKTRMRHRFEEWLDTQDRFAKIKPPSRELLSEWIIASLKEINSETARNSWRRQGFNYFDD